jgi:muramoyltetrapeptide carboxypeptidase LdcA involved in peptidoglycan recycling
VRTTIPAKLKPGDEVRVVSPSSGLGFVPVGQREIAAERLEGLGLRCSFTGVGEELDRFDSSPVEERVAELHEAFADPGVAGLLTIIGGYNSNQLLDHLDYDLIRENPKILCGFSDITALATAIYARAGLVTYSGPHFSTFGMVRGIEYTIEYFERCLMRGEPFQVEPGTKTRRTASSARTPVTTSSTRGMRKGRSSAGTSARSPCSSGRGTCPS